MRRTARQTPKVRYPAALAGIGHGSHVCVFYETKDDLLDLVLPYFESGRGRRELCVWMMPDHVREGEAKIRPTEAVAESGLEFHLGRELYLKEGRFDRDLVTRFWDERVQHALATNRSGLRISGDAFWLQQNDWNAFLAYEADLNAMIVGKPMTVLCTYPLPTSKSGDVFDVVRAHQVAIAKRKDEWEVIAVPGVFREKHAEAVDAAARVSSLTPRERQVLDAIIDGHPNKVIAHNMAIDVRTVEAHRTRLMRRLGVRTIVEAVRLGTLARFATQTPLSSIL